MFKRQLGVALFVWLAAGCAPVKHVPVVVPAKVATMVPPHYPAQAIRQAHEGTVVLLVLVGTSGQPLDIKVSSSAGYRELDKAAIASATKWTYSPETVDGVAKESYVRVPVNFDFGALRKQIQERAVDRYYHLYTPDAINGLSPTTPTTSPSSVQ